MKKKIITIDKLTVYLMMFLLFTGFSSLKAQMVSVIPQEYASGMRNPLMGLRDKAQGSTADLEQIPFTTCFRDYINFNELDNSPTDGLAKVIAYTNTTYKDYEKINAKVIPRVILQFYDNDYYWPADLKSIAGDYKSAVLRARVLKLVDNLGKAWDNDPRVAWVEVGLISKFGEQENPIGVEEPGVAPDGKSWAQILGPAFKAAFKNKMCAVRGPSKWLETSGFNAGVYWDSWGKSSGMDRLTWDYQSECIALNKPPYERYKTAVQAGEVAYNMLPNTTDMGGNERETFITPKYCTYVKNVARKIYTSNLGIEYSVAVAGASQSVKNQVYAGAADIQTVMGYRFVINNFECTKQIASGGQISINANIVNKGNAPMYENWPVAVVLVNSSRQIVWTSSPLNTNVKTWYPGSDYNWVYGMTTTPTYQTPAAVNNVQGTVTVPSNLANGSYYIGLSILEPTTGKPGAFFSVKNFFQESNTQPLCQIGIGVPPNDPTMTSVTFDTYNWFNDTRYYSLNAPAQAPVADFTSDKTSLPVGGTVNFTDSSANTPTSWSWSFPGGTPATSTAQKPSVKYDTEGEYDVTLIATNSTGSSTKTKAKYVVVSKPSTNVTSLTGWVAGTDNPKVPGSNRLLVVMVMGESTGDFSATSVTYGGQTMTKQTDRSYYVASSRSYASIFTLNEAGLNLATNGTIVANWDVTPSSGNSIYSTILSNVDQATPVSAVSNNALTGTTVTIPSGLATASGDMVVMCGATEKNNVQAFDNGFTKEFESDTTWGDGVGGYKIGNGQIETPSFTQSLSGRMVICAFVAKKLAATLAIDDFGNASKNVIKIYPNPTSGILNVNFPNSDMSREIQIINTLGQKVHSVKTRNNLVTIDVKSLNLKGFIIVKVIAEDGVTNHKVLVK